MFFPNVCIINLYHSLKTELLPKQDNLDLIIDLLQSIADWDISYVRNKNRMKENRHNDFSFLLIYSSGHLSSLIEMALWFTCMKKEEEEEEKTTEQKSHLFGDGLMPLLLHNNLSNDIITFLGPTRRLKAERLIWHLNKEKTWRQKVSAGSSAASRRAAQARLKNSTHSDTKMFSYCKCCYVAVVRQSVW